MKAAGVRAFMLCATIRIIGRLIGICSISFYHDAQYTYQKYRCPYSVFGIEGFWIPGLCAVCTPQPCLLCARPSALCFSQWAGGSTAGPGERAGGWRRARRVVRA
jgi:hypothetical protein